MRVKDLSPNPENPRTVTEDRMKSFKKSLDEYGPLWGVVFNKKTNHLVTAHQTVKTIDADTNIVIEKTFKKPTRQGTVSYGYILTKQDERVPYREVHWTENKERAATIAANNHVGDWNEKLLTEWMKDLSIAKFDLDLTMFDPPKIESFYLNDKIEQVNSGSENSEWVEMPEFTPGKTYIRVVLLFSSERKRELYVKAKKLEISKKLNTVWVCQIK